MRFPLGEMTVGDILDRGLKLLFARLPMFYIINLIVLFPVILLQFAVPFITTPGDGAKLDPTALIESAGLGFAVLLVSLILQPIGTAAILYVIMQQYAGKKARIGEAFAFALSRFPSLLGASILAGLIIGIGFLCCCIPGIYFAVSYAFVGQVVVLEKLGVSAGLQRSYSLITNYRWRVFGVLFLIGIATGIIEFGLAFGLQQILPSQEIVPAEGGFRVTLNPVNHIIDTSTDFLVGILFRTYLAVCTTLLYLDLRIRKEGFDLELAAQLDEEPTVPRDDDYNRDDDRDRDDDHDRDDDRPRRDRPESDW